MDLSKTKQMIPDGLKDVRSNLTSVMTPEGSPGLDATQIVGAALSALLTTKSTSCNDLREVLESALESDEVGAVKLASGLMAMTNVYYRFAHSVSDPDYLKMPARLRMNGMRNPGTSKTNFELYSLAASAITGCSLCMDSHAKSLIQHGVSKEGVQSVIRIAAVIHAVNQVLTQENQTAAYAI